MSDFFETATPGEIVAAFTNAEIIEASAETSAIYNGKVLAAAVEIAKRRTRFSVLEMAKRLDLSRNTTHRWSTGMPVAGASKMNRAIVDLALLIDEYGIRR